jgi:hypothetical protein
MMKKFVTFLGILASASILLTNTVNAESDSLWYPPSQDTHSGADIHDFYSSSTSGITRVWAIDDGEKVKREDLQHPLANSPQNLVWDGEKIQLFGARNEVVAFQLILQAGKQGASEVNLRVMDLLQGSYRIPGSDSGSSDPFDYRDTYVELFTEHYLEINSRSVGGTAWTRSAAPSDYYYGWVPDALIPFAAPYGMGGAPFDIPTNLNQAIWVDLYIPRDTPAGRLDGEVLISENGLVTYRIPLELHVYDFSLPDETHFSNMFAISPSDISLRHGIQLDTDEFYEILARYYQMAHRHRMDLVQAIRNLSQIRRFHNRYLTGSLYTVRHGYSGPGEDVGNGTFSIGLYGNLPQEYGGSVNHWSKESWRSGSDHWATWFQVNAPKVSIHKFLTPDEPEDDADLRTIKAQADWSHSNTGVGGSIPTFVTHWIAPEFQGYVDFWSISANHTLHGSIPYTDPDDVQEEREQGRQVGIYNGYRPATGSVLIDTDAVDFRVLPWIGWKYELDQYFYWMTNYWIDHSDGGRRWNIFTNPLNTQTQKNGSGTFFYPGQDMVYKEEDRGLPGPFASIRMKNWRRGMQDYEYLWLARELGLDEDLVRITDQAIPAALWDMNTRSDVTWSERGYRYEALRRELAELIEAKSKQANIDIPSLQFVDVGAEHPYHDEIYALSRLGYMSGCNHDPTAFCPERSMTWAEAATVFGRVLYGSGIGIKTTPSNSFIDLSLSSDYSWAAPWAAALSENDYLSGCAREPYLFCPSTPISRVDSLILMLRTLYGPTFSPPPATGIFSDISIRWEETRWIEIAYQLELLQPCKTTQRMRFCPYATITRGEVAAMVARALGLDRP